MDYTFEEIKGLERQLELLIIRANRTREALAIETNPSVKFQLEIELLQVEAEIYAVKSKLSEKYNFHSPEGETLLAKAIQQLHIEERVGLLHLVNCDRKEKRKNFWDAFDERAKEPFQFYFVPACPTQMPPSFSERMVYEIIIEELQENMEYMLCRRKESSGRIKINDLPLGRNLERSKEEFRKFFSTYLELKDGITLDDFVKTTASGLGHKYVVMTFEIHERKWEDFIPTYLEWLISTFSPAEGDMPKFLFFFVLYMKDLHEDCESQAKKAIIEPVRALVEAHHAAVMLTPLEPVHKDDLEAWLMDLGDTNDGRIAEVIDTMAKGLKDRDLAQYREHRLLNMDDIERLQEIVYKVANKLP